MDIDYSGKCCDLSCSDVLQMWQEDTENIDLMCMEQTCRLAF